MFEQGVSLVAAAHIAAASRQAAKEGRALPAFLQKAELARPKLIDISGDMAVKRDAEVSDKDAHDVLKETIHNVVASSWFGNKLLCMRKLFEFEWDLKMAVDASQASISTVSPRLSLRGAMTLLMRRSTSASDVWAGDVPRRRPQSTGDVESVEV